MSMTDYRLHNDTLWQVLNLVVLISQNNPNNGRSRRTESIEDERLDELLKKKSMMEENILQESKKLKEKQSGAKEEEMSNEN